MFFNSYATYIFDQSYFYTSLFPFLCFVILEFHCDYRPISLFPKISKVLERHVFNYLHNFCTVNQILSNSQFGFRPGRSTESALLSATHSWLSSLDSHNSVCAMFFDLRRTFDFVHLSLMNTLSSIGLCSHLISCTQRLYVIVINKLFSISLLRTNRMLFLAYFKVLY